MFIAQNLAHAALRKECHVPLCDNISPLTG